MKKSQKMYTALVIFALTYSLEAKTMVTPITSETIKKTFHILSTVTCAGMSNFIVRNNRGNLNLLGIISTAYINHYVYQRQPKTIWCAYAVGTLGGMTSRKIVDKLFSLTAWLFTEL